ncbi:MAG: glycosyl transferase family 28 [Taibaiella sp.]|nr:glycosyl transferase family 28 [Taibaiella sp.]
MTKKNLKRILLAPLDWGLGHTARCLPLIRHLQLTGSHVTAAVNHWQRSFIESNCSGIDFTNLDGYNVTYAAGRNLNKIKIAAQVPAICKAITREQKWLQQQVKTLQPDGIISDNRYGIYHPDIPSVIITHQLHVLTGMGKAADSSIQKIHFRLLSKFNQIWVPDVEGATNLAGTLSHPATLPDNTRYIGPLSQMEAADTEATNGGYLLILLSGPEPQRTLLSAILWRQALQHEGKIIFVEGNELAQRPAGVPANITWHNRLAGTALQHALRNASMVICRSGYSTIMDLISAGKRAILIPTPGQTEQEYLGHNLNEQGIMLSRAQESFQLQPALTAAGKFPYNFPALAAHYNDYKPIVNDWVTSL